MQFLSQIAPLIEKSAPFLADALGGPWAASVVKVLMTGFNASTMPDLISALQTNPNAESTLSGLEQQHSGWVTFLSTMKYPSKFSLSIEWN